MCGQDSFEAVESKKTVKKGGKSFVVTVAKILFLVGEDGKIGESHSQIRSTAKLRAGTRYTNINAVGTGFKYENGLDDWYVTLQGKTEAALASIMKAMSVSGPAYAKKIAVARRVMDKAMTAASKLTTSKARNAAENKAIKTFEASKKSAFATISKLGGLQQ